MKKIFLFFIIFSYTGFALAQVAVQYCICQDMQGYTKGWGEGANVSCGDPNAVANCSFNSDYQVQQYLLNNPYNAVAP